MCFPFILPSWRVHQLVSADQTHPGLFFRWLRTGCAVCSVFLIRVLEGSSFTGNVLVLRSPCRRPTSGPAKRAEGCLQRVCTVVALISPYTCDESTTWGMCVCGMSCHACMCMCTYMHTHTHNLFLSVMVSCVFQEMCLFRPKVPVQSGPLPHHLFTVRRACRGARSVSPNIGHLGFFWLLPTSCVSFLGPPYESATDWAVSTVRICFLTTWRPEVQDQGASGASPAEARAPGVWTAVLSLCPSWSPPRVSVSWSLLTRAPVARPQGPPPCPHFNVIPSSKALSPNAATF